jgi:hypothetical protein
LAVAITGFLLLLLSPNDLGVAQQAEEAQPDDNSASEIVLPTQASPDEEADL